MKPEDQGTFKYRYLYSFDDNQEKNKFKAMLIWFESDKLQTLSPIAARRFELSFFFV